jgi:hypothetical protein
LGCTSGSNGTVEFGGGSEADARLNRALIRVEYVTDTVTGRMRFPRDEMVDVAQHVAVLLQVYEFMAGS